MHFLPFSEYDWLVSWPALAAYCVAYLVVIFGLRATASSREKYQLKGFLMLYNAAQIVLCGYMTVGFYQAAFSVHNPFYLNGAYTARIEYFFLIHFLSKLLDFCDTFVMCFKQNWRQFTFLHVYHHTTILLIWGFLLQQGHANGTAYFGAFLNSIIHFLM
jgi:elongation of very long chain fatty acids protein 4